VRCTHKESYLISLTVCVAVCCIVVHSRKYANWCVLPCLLQCVAVCCTRGETLSYELSDDSLGPTLMMWCTRVWHVWRLQSLSLSLSLSLPLSCALSLSLCFLTLSLALSLSLFLSLSLALCLSLSFSQPRTYTHNNTHTHTRTRADSKWRGSSRIGIARLAR